jgi:hypothetical protein
MGKVLLWGQLQQLAFGLLAPGLESTAVDQKKPENSKSMMNPANLLLRNHFVSEAT